MRGCGNCPEVALVDWKAKMFQAVLEKMDVEMWRRSLVASIELVAWT